MAVKTKPALRDVAVVSVPVSDQERAKEFYVDKLGMDVLRDDSSMPASRWLQVAPAGASCSLTLVTWFDSMPPGTLQGLVVRSADLQGDYELLVSRGVTFDQAPEQQPWGMEAVCRDPDGNRLVLQQI